MKPGPRARTWRELEDHLLTHRTITEQGCWEWTLSRFATRGGYGQTARGSKKLYVHRVAAFLWLGFDLDSRLDVCHHCDNPPCFNPGHLFIGNARANAEDMLKKGRARTDHANRRRGEEVPNHVLTESDVRQIRALAATPISNAAIARKYGVSKNLVGFIVRRRAWAHVQ